MEKTKTNHRYDSNGNPCNFTDEEGVYFRYVGSKDGWDHWEGSPKDS